MFFLHKYTAPSLYNEYRYTIHFLYSNGAGYHRVIKTLHASQILDIPPHKQDNA